MTALSRGLDLALWGLAATAWGLAAFALASRFISETAGGLLGLAVAVSGVAYVISNHLRDSRLDSLQRGSCPRCGAGVQPEHQHRRWDPSSSSWASPSTAWECGSCGFGHAESWACPQCPSQP